MSDFTRSPRHLKLYMLWPGRTPEQVQAMAPIPLAPRGDMGILVEPWDGGPYALHTLAGEAFMRAGQETTLWTSQIRERYPRAIQQVERAGALRQAERTDRVQTLLIRALGEFLRLAEAKEEQHGEGNIWYIAVDPTSLGVPR